MKRQLSYFLLLASAGANLASAEIIFYGPSPYLGAFDSPFLAGIEAGTIYLEDFEDHALNTPFIVVNDFDNDPANGWRGTTVKTRNPMAPANSVDADDGLNGDFIGFDGDAWTNSSIFANSYQHEFLFTPDAQGRYPRYVGFVVTDPEDFLDEDVVVTMLDPDGEDVMEQEEFDPDLWNPAFVGDTGAHRFIGAFSSTGIEFLRIEGVDELDHLQYGYSIPEPSAGLLALMAASLLVRRRRLA